MIRDIRLEREDYRVIIEVSRLGTGTLTQLMFATGDFSGSLPIRLCRLMDMKAVDTLGREGDNTRYVVTGEGLVSVYLEDAFVRSIREVYGKQMCRFKRLKLRQRAARPDQL